MTGFLQFAMLVNVVWWSWSGETFYQNRFVADDLIHRILVFIQIFGVASLGLSVSGAFGDLSGQFTIAYVVVRLMLILMYVRAGHTHPESKPLTRGYIMGFGVGMLVWLSSLLFAEESRWIIWLVGMTIELTVPLMPTLRDRLRTWNVDNHHLSERFGIFTIIVLGESFVKILDDAQGATLGADQLLFSVGGLTVVYSLWWLYFSDTADKAIDVMSQFKPVAWVYGHLPLSISLVAFGVGAKKLFAETIDHPGEALTEKYRLLYTASIVIFLAALAMIDFGIDDDETPENQIIEALVHTISAIVVLIIGFTMTGLTSIEFVLIIAVVMTAQVVFSVYQTMKSTGESSVEEATA